jgi:hypothetical protein
VETIGDHQAIYKWSQCGNRNIKEIIVEFPNHCVTDYIKLQSLVIGCPINTKAKYKFFNLFWSDELQDAFRGNDYGERFEMLHIYFD